MRINILDVPSRELDHLCERVTARAIARDLPPEEAFRQALRGWLERTGEGLAEPERQGDRVLEATEAELEALKAVLAAMRSYDSIR
jgi:hypothetical protein